MTSKLQLPCALVLRPGYHSGAVVVLSWIPEATMANHVSSGKKGPRHVEINLSQLVPHKGWYPVHPWASWPWSRQQIYTRRDDHHSLEGWQSCCLGVNGGGHVIIHACCQPHASNVGSATLKADSKKHGKYHNWVGNHEFQPCWRRAEHVGPPLWSSLRSWGPIWSTLQVILLKHLGHVWICTAMPLYLYSEM